MKSEPWLRAGGGKQEDPLSMPARRPSVAHGGEPGCEVDRLKEAARVGNALPGDIKGGSMVDTGAGHREPKRDIHGPVKGDHFDWNMSLVVVHADDRVISLPGLWGEGRVAGNGPGHIESASAGLHNGWGDDGFLFVVPKQSMLAGVRVEPADQEPRPLPPNAEECLIGQVEHLGNPSCRQQRRDVGIADMGGDKAAGDVIRVLKHATTAGLKPLGKQFGMARIMVPGSVKRFFIERAGNNGIDRTRHRVTDGGDARLKGRRSGCCGDLARQQPSSIHRGTVVDRGNARGSGVSQHRGGEGNRNRISDPPKDRGTAVNNRQAVAEPSLLSSSEKSQAEFWANPGRVAEGHRQTGQTLSGACHDGTAVAAAGAVFLRK